MTRCPEKRQEQRHGWCRHVQRTKTGPECHLPIQPRTELCRRLMRKMIVCYSPFLKKFQQKWYLYGCSHIHLHRWDPLLSSGSVSCGPSERKHAFTLGAPYSRSTDRAGPALVAPMEGDASCRSWVAECSQQGRHYAPCQVSVMTGPQQQGGGKCLSKARQREPKTFP